MKTILILTSIFVYTLFSGVYTERTTSTYQGKGYGISREEAINNAIIEAIGQIHGVKMTKLSNTADTLLEIDDKSSISSKYSSKIEKITYGKVNSYTIEQVNQIDKNQYEAIISVKKITKRAKYKSPGLNPRKRRALAVLPFEFKKSYTIDGINIQGDTLSLRITQSIINQITQTRKFTILDRQNSRYYNIEKAFLKSGNTDPVELARLGKRLGTDYFVIGQILDFGTQTKTSTNYYSGDTASNSQGFATIAYRVINIPTQQIKYSETIDIEFNMPTSKRTESIITKAGNKVAQVLTEQIIFNIYPPKVIKVHGERGIINMGGKMLHSGETMQVFSLGKKLYDPYTKESLGREEKKIGEIQILTVKPKFSTIKVISGYLQKGAVLRKIKTTENQEKTTSNGEKDSMFDAMFSK